MRTVLRAITNRPYETTVVMRNRGGVVGAVCNRPLGVAVHANGVAGDRKSPLRNHGGHAKPWWCCRGGLQPHVGCCGACERCCGRLQIVLTKPRWPYENAVVIRKRGGHTV